MNSQLWSVFTPYRLAICSQVKTLFGLRVQQAGLLYSIEERPIVGRIAIGKQTSADWIEGRA